MFTMLVVDDNPNDRMGVTGLIDWSEQEIEVVGTAVNGADGYRQASELRPDFILTDVSMPLMNGIEMTEKIKRELPDTRFVFMSCFDDLAYLQAAIDLEVNAYVLKPIELDELVQVFAKLRGLKEGDLRKRRKEASLQKLVEESLPLLREQFMKELFQREEVALAEVEERLAYLKLAGGRGSYAVLYMQIDNYELRYRSMPVHKRHLLLYSLQSRVRESLSEATGGWAVASHYDTLLALVPCPLGEELGFLNGVTELANRCIEAVNEQLELQLTIGIGDISSDWTRVATAYRQAETAARSKFYSKGNQVIFYAEFGRRGTRLETDTSQLASEVRTLLAQRQESRIEALLDAYYGTDAAFSEKEIKLLSYTIVHVVQSSLLEAGKSIADVSGDEPKLWKDLSLLETIVEVRGLIRQLLHNACQALVRDEAIGKNKRIVENLKAIIDERYASIESVHQIVEHLQISASHANLIFKRESGQTMFDYLTQRRVEAAKGMLRNDPYLKVYEVADKVGYRTEAHFRSVFKAHTGLTPGKFQETASQ